MKIREGLRLIPLVIPVQKRWIKIMEWYSPNHSSTNYKYAMIFNYSYQIPSLLLSQFDPSQIVLPRSKNKRLEENNKWWISKGQGYFKRSQIPFGEGLSGPLVLDVIYECHKGHVEEQSSIWSLISMNFLK